eukprot:COSAG04_NODE_2132_length_4728_cov_2.884424_2_plen_99_part_00
MECPEPSAAELAELAAREVKPSALKKRAKEVGVEEDKLEEADGADDVKVTPIELIEKSPQAQLEEKVKQLREELGGMNLGAEEAREGGRGRRGRARGR